MEKVKAYELLGELHADTVNYCKENKIGYFRTYGNQDYLLFRNAKGTTLQQALKNLTQDIKEHIKNIDLLKRAVELSELVNNLNIGDNKLGLYQCSNHVKKDEWSNLENKYLSVYLKRLKV